jgi:hypothetical protein
MAKRKTGSHREIGDKSLPWVAWCACMNGDTCTRYCRTEDEALYWQWVWENCGGRVSLAYQNEDRRHAS